MMFKNASAAQLEGNAADMDGNIRMKLWALPFLRLQLQRTELR